MAKECLRVWLVTCFSMPLLTAERFSTRSIEGVCGAGANSICMSFADNMYLIKEAVALKILLDLNES